jgi:hypothetical protein
MLSSASAHFLQELYSFLGIYYNYSLTRTLVDLDYHLSVSLSFCEPAEAQPNNAANASFI